MRRYNFVVDLRILQEFENMIKCTSESVEAHLLYE